MTNRHIKGCPNWKNKICSECGTKDSSVKMRKCGYTEEIHGEIRMHQVCDDCEEEHLMDI